MNNGKMKNFTLYTLLFTLYSSPFTLHAGAFDNVGLNARPVGMGNAFTAVSDDLNSIYYNPAGVGKVNKQQIIFSYRDFYSLGLVTQNYVATSIPGRLVNTAISIHRIGTTDAVEFNYIEDTYIVTVAGRLTFLKNLFCGANFKFYHVLSESNASGWGLDTGLLYELFPKKFNLGLVLQNLNSPKIIWDTGAKDKLDINFRPGICISPVKNIKVAFDCEKSDKLNSGIELWLLRRMIGIRAGIGNLTSKENTSGYGLSFRFNSLQLDYALSKHYALDWTHFFTLLVRVGK
ncbi:MAG: hypothetical protein V1833_06595 [Elusimicrobiota bacterium]